MAFSKVNDLSNSKLRQRYFEDSFVPESNVAVGFGRVSLKKNKEKGNSDVAQLETIEFYVDREGLKLDRTWDVAETASKHHKRKHFHEMLAYVQSHKIKHIVFSHQSRSNRNRESAKELETLVRQHGVTLHCARDNLKLTVNSGIEEWLRWDIFNILNEKFIKDHTRNVADGLIKRIEMGLYPGKAPYGYKNYRPAENALSVFVFDPVAKPVMETAFELFATGDYSPAALEKELKRRFPKTKIPGYKQLWELLRNPFYYGDFMYDGEQYKGNPEYHPPMVPFVLWKLVQDVFNKPNRSKRTVTQRRHPYIGLIKCAGRILDEHGNETDETCGCAVTAEEIRKKRRNGSLAGVYYYWRCSNTTRRCSQRDKQYLSTAGRQKISYSEAQLEEIMAQMFEPLHFPEEVCRWMQSVLKEHHGRKSADDRKQRSAVQTRYEMVSRYIEKAYQDKLDGLLDEQTWRQKNSAWMVEQDQLRRQLGDMSVDNGDYLETGVLLIELAQRTKTIFKSATPDVKRQLVEIISSNRRLRNGKLEFDYQKPFDLIARSGCGEDWWR